MAAHNKLLGQFDLVGIPPAPRGTPKIEVPDPSQTFPDSVVVQPPPYTPTHTTPSSPLFLWHWMRDEHGEKPLLGSPGRMV